MTSRINTSEQIPQPLQHEPDELVMNVYPIPGSDIAPDYHSQDHMGLYLEERLQPDPGPTFHIALEATGRFWPGFRRIPTGYREVDRYRTTGDWLISPRVAAAVMLGSAILFNGVGNRETIEGATEWTGHEVYRAFNPVHDTKQIITHTTETPGKVIDIQESAAVATTDVSGFHINLNSQEIKSLSDKIQVVKSKGGKVLSMEVVGETSNDWGTKGDAAFGHPNSENEKLGTDIARSAFAGLKTNLESVGLTGIPITLSQHESVLTDSQAKSLISEAKIAGYGSLETAVKAVDQGQLSQGNLFQRIRNFISSKRGESIDVKIEMPGAVVTHVTHETKVIPGVDHAPEVPKPHWYWFIPMLPISRFERYSTMKETHRLKFVPTQEVMRPSYIREEANQAWLRIRPEAVNKDSTLVDNAWAYTRKYEHLLRDDRIVEVLRADFKNPQGKDASLRIMFVDESPAKETVDVFTGLLEKFAAMDGGKISDRVKAIFVYPSENAGTQHDEAKRIAVGVDKQSAEEVVGTYTYILDLVELHMPTKVDARELQSLLTSIDGAAWTLAHEVAGHATDDNDQPLRLRRVITSGIANAHIIDGDPRAHKMKPLQKILQKLPKSSQHKKTPIQFDISYPVVDNNGQIVTKTARVPEGDDRLAHATHATIVDYQPTQYASTSPSEHYAETAAADTTGIEIPFSDASVTVPGQTTDRGHKASFATGYRPDVRGQQLFTRSVGANDGEFPVTFKNPPSVTIVRTSAADDPVLRKEMVRTRGLVTLTPQEMVAILARATRRQKA